MWVGSECCGGWETEARLAACSTEWGEGFHTAISGRARGGAAWQPVLDGAWHADHR